MNYKIREIDVKDNSIVEKIIRDCLIEFNANHEGTAWTDPDLGRFSEVYNSLGNKYFVCEDSNGNVCGGVGIGNLGNGICELQKMYCIPEVRGCGVSKMLIDAACEYAKKYYDKCYLETLDNMKAAQRFYEKNGFVRVYEPIVETEHFACDVRYIKDL